ncbi:MAG: Re/Si-specific NAD(P)(+) transhydrogenase subunit alpha [Planctomycetota bacterium]
MVTVFVPKESAPGETRVAVVPETAKALAKSGLRVVVEANAGVAAGFLDEDYRQAGAEVGSAADASSADVVLRVRPPEVGSAETQSLRAGAVVVCSLQPMLHLPLVRELAERKVTCIALDLVPRITRAQKMDILSSQATIAGYYAVLMAAAALPQMFPLMMTAAGTLKPAKVVILGAGVAGLQAIATARRLGAVVEANDIRPAVKEQVESLGARFIDTGAPPQAETTGGYAKETSAEYARKQRETLTEHFRGADVVITTALIPGRKAPVLMTDDMIQVMRAGSVIVDLAVEMGGNVEGSKAGETVTLHGVKIIGEPNLPACVPADASRMFSRNVQALLELVLSKEGELAVQWEDEVIAAAAVTRDGDIRHEASAEALAAKGAS